MNFLRLLNHIISRPLNADARLAAIGRFLRWQLASRMIDRPISLPFVDDTVLLTASGMTGSTQNWYCGLQEPSEMGFTLHFLRPNDLFLDIGANVGSFTVLAGGCVKAHVISVEPVPSTYKHLQANIRLNDLRGVEAHCCGLSSKTGELSFTAELDTLNRVALPDEASSTVSVPVTTLDLLMRGRIPKLMKIDVEGHELSVLEGAGETLSSPVLQAVILETNGSGARYGITDDVLYGAMIRFGFEPCNYDPYSRRLTLQERSSENTIFVKDIETANRCCAEAPRYRLVNGTI